VSTLLQCVFVSACLSNALMSTVLVVNFFFGLMFMPYEMLMGFIWWNGKIFLPLMIEERY